MGLVSGNRLNRFWQKGVKPIKDAIGVLSVLSTVDKSTLVAAINELADGKFDVAKLIASTNITEPGFAMDGKTAADALAELYSNIQEYIIAQNVTSTTYNLSPGASVTCEFNVPDIDGYKPLVGFYSGNSVDPAIVPFIGTSIPNNGKLTLGVYNAANKSIGNILFVANILYVKS